MNNQLNSHQRHPEPADPLTLLNNVRLIDQSAGLPDELRRYPFYRRLKSYSIVLLTHCLIYYKGFRRIVMPAFIKFFSGVGRK